MKWQFIYLGNLNIFLSSLNYPWVPYTIYLLYLENNLIRESGLRVLAEEFSFIPKLNFLNLCKLFIGIHTFRWQWIWKFRDE